MFHECPVLIVGGGPVGLSAAIMLARQGIRSLLVERHSSTTNHPKARGFFTRTMEILRHWGIDAAVRSAALPLGAWRFVWMDSLTGRELGQVAPPGRGRPGTQSPTYLCGSSQDSFEAELLRHALTYAEIDVRFHTELVAFAQDDDVVTATILDRTAGTSVEIHARYMIAADGGASFVRSTLGIEMLGQSNMASNVNIHFRADLSPWVTQRRALGYLFARDYTRLLWAGGSDRWIILRTIRPEQGESAGDFTPDHCIRLARDVVGIPDLPVEVINLLFWTLAADAAEHFRVGRIFLAGDAAHRLPPTGGFGANTGIQDAHNLAWKIAAVLKGWAGAALLDTYEQERRPVAESNIAFSLGNIQRGMRVFRDIASGGEAALASSLAEQQKHLDCDGQDLGFHYASEAITPDGTLPPDGDSQTYVPSARPGSRAPHVWLRRTGASEPQATPLSTLDLFEGSFVLLVGTDGGDFLAAGRQAAKKLGLPFEGFTIGPGGDFVSVDAEWAQIYELDADGAVLVRPDGHVAWRSRCQKMMPEQILEDALRKAAAR